MSAVTSAESKPPTILVCDDDPMVRLLAKECLEEAGMKVTEAADGLQAVESFLEHLPDLIFLDIEMPNLNGFEVCARIRQLPQGENVPILIATGADDRDSIDEGFQSGATQYKTKPINWSLLSRDVRYMLRSAADFTALQAREADLEYLAYHDQLTGLPNRSSFLEHMSRNTGPNRMETATVGLLLLSIDHFKRINDSLGHDAGDQILNAIARGVKDGLAKEAPTSFAVDANVQTSPPADETIDLMRTGGSEFSIVVRNANDQRLDALAQIVLDILDDPVVLTHYQLLLSPNIGVTSRAADSATSEELVREAGLALRASQKIGRCHFRRYDTSLADDTQERLVLENDLNTALISGDQLFMMYQPQIQASTGKIEGVEALVRWQHPDLGMIPPDKFVDIAEGSGQIIALGNWIVRRISQDVAQHEAAFPLNWTIGINLSPLQFTQSNFVEMLGEMLGTLSAKRTIELELTEGVVMSDAADSLTKLSALKSKGFRLAIDDFGTGYSSLSYLQDFPIDTLKIDRAFISRTGTEHGDGIVKAILRLGQALGIKVIAEGVETQEQAQLLIQNACDSLQGYLYSKPVLVEELKALQEVSYDISTAATSTAN